MVALCTAAASAGIWRIAGFVHLVIVVIIWTVPGRAVTCNECVFPFPEVQRIYRMRRVPRKKVKQDENHQMDLWQKELVAISSDWW